MDRHNDIRLLGMKKTRRAAMKKLLDQAVERRRMMEDSRVSPAALLREEINIHKLIAEIARLDDEISAMGSEIGIDPKGGYAESN